MDTGRWLVVAALGAAPACDVSAVHKPRPPSTDALRARFTEPQGTLAGLDADHAAELLAEGLAQLEEVCAPPDDAEPCTGGALGCSVCAGEDRLSELVHTLAGAIDRGAIAHTSLPGVEGALTATLLCRGWEPSTSPDPQHGSVTLQLSFTGLGLDPVLWGHFSACEDRHGRSRRQARIDGDVLVSFEPARWVSLAELDRTPVIIGFEGSIETPELDEPLDVRWALRRRLDGEGERALSVDVPGLGDFLLRSQDGRTDVLGRGLQVVCTWEGATCVPAEAR